MDIKNKRLHLQRIAAIIEMMQNLNFIVELFAYTKQNIYFCDINRIKSNDNKGRCRVIFE
jgi:hypothetical protein